MKNTLQIISLVSGLTLLILLATAQAVLYLAPSYAAVVVVNLPIFTPFFF